MDQINGLKLSNSWAGYQILLNPDFKAAIQWRFVNRAIDEVENDQVRQLYWTPYSGADCLCRHHAYAGLHCS